MVFEGDYKSKNLLNFAADDINFVYTDTQANICNLALQNVTRCLPCGSSRVGSLGYQLGMGGVHHSETLPPPILRKCPVFCLQCFGRAVPLLRAIQFSRPSRSFLDHSTNAMAVAAAAGLNEVSTTVRASSSGRRRVSPPAGNYIPALLGRLKVYKGAFALKDLFSAALFFTFNFKLEYAYEKRPPIYTPCKL